MPRGRRVVDPYETQGYPNFTLTCRPEGYIETVWAQAPGPKVASILVALRVFHRPSAKPSARPTCLVTLWLRAGRTRFPLRENDGPDGSWAWTAERPFRCSRCLRRFVLEQNRLRAF